MKIKSCKIAYQYVMLIVSLISTSKCFINCLLVHQHVLPIVY